MEKIKKAAEYINSKIKNKPEIALVLGSGLGDLAEEIENPVYINYSDIPGFPESTVVGHKGRLVLGQLSGKEVVAMQGRFHFYEGYPIQEVVFPTRVLGYLGIETLIVTNAAGGVDTSFDVGDLMIIEDHINFAGQNPLIGANYDELGPRFPDMSSAYDEEYIELAEEVGKDLGLNLRKGVYMWWTGPTYETPTEVRMARTLGASAVGMSTVPEVIVARHQGVKVLGISCITNMASGVLEEKLSHEDVVETSKRVKKDFQGLVLEVLKRI